VLVAQGMDRADLVATCWIAYLEARAAFGRRLSPGDRRRARADLDRDWSRYLKIEVTDPLIREAAAVADTYRLRGYDAMHVAAARALRERRIGAITFGSWDHEQQDAASRDGFLLLAP
jgi:predicted nucleic acid-binding protein